MYILQKLEIQVDRQDVTKSGGAMSNAKQNRWYT